MWKILRFLVSALAIFGSAYFIAEKATWGFTIARLYTDKQTNFDNSGEDPAPYLRQRFFLSAQGGQSYVLISEDNTLVLKFFKDMPRPWLIKSSYQQKKWGKLERTLNGYQLAFDHLQDETALLSLHFKPTQDRLPVRVVDRLNIEHTIDLSSVFFVIQKRALPLSFSQFQTHIDAIYKLLQKRKEAHIDDHDPRLLTNIGWSDGKPIFIDPGRFVHD